MTREPSDRAAPAETQRVDLHLHSDASDGTVPPREVVRQAAAAGLSGISLTDHDTLVGLEEAADEARTLGLDFLPGAELSANEPGRSVHLLAFGFDLTDGSLRAFLERFDEDRRRRAREIVNRLRGLGVSIRYRDVEDQAGRAAPTRAHVARALVAGGHVAEEEESFRRYLSRGRPAHVAKRPTPPESVIERVHASGGVVLIAHPGRAHGEAEIRRWVAQGLDGVEVLHPVHGEAVRARMSALSDALGLLKSGGSDWHGPGTRRSEIGTEPVPAAWMREIEARCPAMRA